MPPSLTPLVTALTLLVGAGIVCTAGVRAVQSLYPWAVDTGQPVPQQPTAEAQRAAFNKAFPASVRRDLEADLAEAELAARQEMAKELADWALASLAAKPQVVDVHSTGSSVRMSLSDGRELFAGPAGPEVITDLLAELEDGPMQVRGVSIGAAMHTLHLQSSAGYPVTLVVPLISMPA